MHRSWSAPASCYAKPLPDQPWVGGAVGAGGGRGPRGNQGSAAAAAEPARVSSSPAGTPIYDAGLEVGDVITAVDGRAIAAATDFAEAVGAHHPGERVRVTFTNPSGEHTVTLTIRENPALETVLFEAAGRTPSAEQLAFRARWLESKGVR